MGSFFEIDLDLEALGDLEQITVHDECGEYEDIEFYREGILARDNTKLRELCKMSYGRLKTAQELTGMGLIDARFVELLHEVGIGVADG